MRAFIRFLFSIALFGLVFLAHIAVRYIFSLPLGTVNVTLAALSIMVIFAGRGSVVWASFFIHFLLELWSSIPFGIVLFSGTMSVLLTYWLFHFVLTNRSWYLTLAVTAFCVLLYRALFLFALLGSALTREGEFRSLDSAWLLYGWEIVTTSALVLIVYGGVEAWRRLLHPRRTITWTV